jgi:hypothetical protein
MYGILSRLGGRTLCKQALHTGVTLDNIGWFIATLHQLIGHDKAAQVLGQPVGDKECCLICIYEQHPTDANRQAVIEALGPS